MKEKELEQIAKLEIDNFSYVIKQPKEDIEEDKTAFYVALGKMIFK